tara:strand:+ start:111 stop:269 length:159 start_codon:yes stop_codon:yes gene_type:complete
MRKPKAVNPVRRLVIVKIPTSVPKSAHTPVIKAVSHVITARRGQFHFFIFIA